MIEIPVCDRLYTQSQYISHVNEVCTVCDEFVLYLPSRKSQLRAATQCPSSLMSVSVKALGSCATVCSQVFIFMSYL